MAPIATDDESERITLARIDERLKTLEREVSDIKSIFRWLAITIGGAVILAFLNFALTGGLKLTGGG
jgi:hypothetical protein